MCLIYWQIQEFWYKIMQYFNSPNSKLTIDGEQFEHPKRIKRLIGKIKYFRVICPNIAYLVSMAVNGLQNVLYYIAILGVATFIIFLIQIGMIQRQTYNLLLHVIVCLLGDIMTQSTCEVMWIDQYGVKLVGDILTELCVIIKLLLILPLIQCFMSKLRILELIVFFSREDTTKFNICRTYKD